MGSMSVSSCKCCMFVSCVHPVAVLNAEFCMTYSLLMLVEDAYERGILQSWSHNCLIGSHECLILFTPSSFLMLHIHVSTCVVEALHGSHVFCLSSHVRWRCAGAQRENTKRILLLFSYGNIICRHLQQKILSGLYNLMDIHFITFWKYLIV